MNLFYFALKNIFYSPTKSILSVLLISLSIGILLTTYIVQEQYSNHLAKNANNIDCVLAAKGSPLQSVLANVYHVDFSTGNINISDIKPFLNKNHPIIAESLPISIGDNVNGYRIVGVTPEFLSFFNLRLEEGNIFQKNFDAVLGNEVAKNLNLHTGSSFLTSHGLVETNEHQHEKNLTVSGLLSKQNSIMDRLIFIPIAAYWDIHHSDIELPSYIITNDSLITFDQQITALLIKYKTKNVQSLNFIRNVNENTSVMAASPAIEVNRLYELTGSFSELLNTIGIFIAILSIVSILFNLFQALQERKFELALMRLQGGRPIHLFSSVFFEGMIMVSIGLVLGFILSHTAIYFYGQYSGLQSKFGIKGNEWVEGELQLGILFLLIGACISILPALKAFRTNIIKTLRSN